MNKSLKSKEHQITLNSISGIEVIKKLKKNKIKKIIQN